MPTAHGARYVEQLRRHWEHRLSVGRAEGGWVSVELPSGSLVRLSASTEALDVSIQAADETLLSEAQNVVQAHLDRFAFREGALQYDWRLHSKQTPGIT